VRVEPPPRLPVVPPPLPPGWGRPPLVHRVPVLAAAGAALVLVGAALAWAALHPSQRSAAPPPAAAVSDGPVASILPAAVSLPAPAPEPPAAPAQPPAEPRQRRVKLAVQSFAAPAQPPAPPEPRPVGQTYGTRVTFLASPEEAMRVAQRERKLVFVLHVSGNFEESCFT
jgi:hypothetical protein